MTKAPYPHLDPKMREILEKLANGLFPLQAWIKDKDERRVPPPKDAGQLPWRNGKRLAPKDTGAIEFFEHLLTDPEEEAELLERWEQLERNPLHDFHLQGKEATAWRAARGLDVRTQFGVLESENILVDIDERPVIRLHFYRAFWPLLHEAVHKRSPRTEQDWIGFARELHNDECPEWPTGQPLHSSTLTFQLGRDLLHAMMNMDNTAAEPWKHALLIELGEHRRVGNEWTRRDAEIAVKEFDEMCAKARSKKRPPKAPEALVASTDIPPIGTPPQKPYKGRRSPLVQGE